MMATTLYERLQSDDPGVRRVAVLDLPYSDEEDDIVPLLVVALSDPDACVRLEAAKASGRYKSPIVTQIEPAPTFWRAEDYHQRYFQKHGGSCHVSFAEVQNS